MQSPEVKDLFTALSKAQGEFHAAKKDASNPFFKSHYADLESVWEAVRAPLTKHGLCVIQRIAQIDGVVLLITTVGHSSGQWFEGSVPLNPVKNDPQSMGSAITYHRRYSLAAMLGVVQTDDNMDDDGEGAMNRPKLPSGQTAPRIFADQPGPDDGIFRGKFTSGKFGDKYFDQIPIDQLRSYVAFVQDTPRTKPLTKVFSQELADANRFIIDFETPDAGALG